MSTFHVDVIPGLTRAADGTYYWETLSVSNKYKTGDEVITAYKGNFRVTKVSPPYIKENKKYYVKVSAERQ